MADTYSTEAKELSRFSSPNVAVGTHFTETSSVNIYRMSASLNTNRYNPPAENDFRIEQKRVNFIFETKKKQSTCQIPSAAFSIDYINKTNTEK